MYKKKKKMVGTYFVNYLAKSAISLNFKPFLSSTLVRATLGLRVRDFLLTPNFLSFLPAEFYNKHKHLND